MIAIKEISHYVPMGFESNFDKKDQFDVDDNFIINKIGVHRVSRKAKHEETSDMCMKAYRSLELKTNIRIEDIDCIIVCTQNPDGGGIPHSSAIVHGKLGCKSTCAAFDISLGCSGYVYGLSVAKSFMEGNGLKNCLLFTADPYSKIINPNDRNTVLLFGDAAAVTWLSESTEDNGFWYPANFVFGSIGHDYNVLRKENGHLTMNGRAIVNFAVKAIPSQVAGLLNTARLSLDDIDYFVLHQGSKFIIDKLVDNMGLPAEKVPCNLAPQGNTISSSIPILLEKYLKDESLNRMVLCGFGVGLSCATCLIQKNIS
jgi:3-oxoacyl-[acyl-carrier-protein] synthase-3